jgi:hypothetical protein
MHAARARCLEAKVDAEQESLVIFCLARKPDQAADSSFEHRITASIGSKTHSNFQSLRYPAESVGGAQTRISLNS